MKVLKILITLLLPAALSLGLPAAGPGPDPAHDEKLDAYVQLGLESNLALKQREFSLEKSLQALKEAKGMFLPSVSIEARYSRAGGGRVIEMPIGDMVNPMQDTLNQLLTIHGAQPVFPANIPNESIPFLREEEQDTKLRIVQPLFQPGIYYNYKIKKDLTRVEKAKLNAFKRELTSEIKKAFFNFKKTVKVKELLDQTRGLLEENLHLNRSLFRNHKQTEEVVFRARAELSNLDRDRADAEKNVKLAASYFNFLLNRPLDTAVEVGVEIEKGPETPVFNAYDRDTLVKRALTHRQEFKQLNAGIAAANHQASMHRASILPTVNAVFDYGFQGEKYSFKGEDDYWMGSLVMSWNLFRGGQDAAKKKQALYEKRKLEAKNRELELQIRLQVTEAWHNLEVAKKTVTSTSDSSESRKQAFDIVARKYKEGMVPQIEYMKARNDLTQAAVQHIIAVYDYYTKEAQLQRTAPKS